MSRTYKGSTGQKDKAQKVQVWSYLGKYIPKYLQQVWNPYVVIMKMLMDSGVLVVLVKTIIEVVKLKL